jgi:hypothetical protein
MEHLLEIHRKTSGLSFANTRRSRDFEKQTDNLLKRWKIEKPKKNALCPMSIFSVSMGTF